MIQSQADAVHVHELHVNNVQVIDYLLCFVFTKYGPTMRVEAPKTWNGCARLYIRCPQALSHCSGKHSGCRHTHTHASVDMQMRAQPNMLCEFVSGLLAGGRVQAATL